MITDRPRQTKTRLLDEMRTLKAQIRLRIRSLIRTFDVGLFGTKECINRRQIPG